MVDYTSESVPPSGYPFMVNTPYPDPDAVIHKDLETKLPAAIAPGIWNVTPTSLKNLRKAKAQVMALKETPGVAVVRPIIAFCGESYARSEQSGDGGAAPAYVNAHIRSMNYMLAKQLTAAGYPAKSNAIFGMSNQTAELTQSEWSGLLTIGAGWGTDSGNTLGGKFFVNSTTTNPISLAVPDAIDTAKFWFARAPSNGGFNANFDGGGNTLVPTAGALAFQSATVTTSLGVKTLNVARATGYIGLAGIHVYDSTKSEFDVINMGWGASTTANWTASGNAWDPFNAHTIVAPVCTVLIEMGNNAINSLFASGGAAFRTQYQSLITQFKRGGAGDVICVIPGYVNPSAPSREPTNYDKYAAVVRELALLNDCVLIDWRVKLGSYAQAVANGQMADVNHPNWFGYPDVGAMISQVVLAA